MTKSISITNYHAKWCGHCTTFKPEWKAIEQYLNENNNEIDGIKITTFSLEETQIGKMGGGKINGVDIKGFPTIKIELINGGTKKEYDTSNFVARNSKSMITFLKHLCSGLKKL